MQKIKKGIISNSPCYHILKVLVQYLIYLYLSWNGILLLDHHLHDKNLIYDIGKKKQIRLGFMKDLNGHLSSYSKKYQLKRHLL